MVKDLEGTINEIGLVVGNAPLLAKGMDKLVSFAEVVSGDHGEEVVLDLVLEAAAEPVDEGLGDACPPVMFRVVVTCSVQKSGRVAASYVAMPLWPRPKTRARNRPHEQVAMKKYAMEYRTEKRPNPVEKASTQA